MTPSTGFLSAVSIASENSFPNVPKSDTAIARMPANGPSPTTLMKISAQISTSTPRIASRKRRTAKCANTFGTTFFAARKPTGKASTAADQRAEQRDRQRFGQRVQEQRQLGPGRRREHHARRYGRSAPRPEPSRPKENSRRQKP